MQRVQAERTAHVEGSKYAPAIKARSFERPHQHQTGVNKEHQDAELADVPKEIPLRALARVDAVQVRDEHQQNGPGAQKVEIRRFMKRSRVQLAM